MTFFFMQLQATADSHRVKATTAEDPAETLHWLAEADRFDRLARVATVNPDRARALYRPTRSFEPEETE